MTVLKESLRIMCNDSDGSFTYTETSPGDGALSKKWVQQIIRDRYLSQNGSFTYTETSPGDGPCLKNGSFTYTETSPRNGVLSQKWLIHIHGDLSQGRGPVPEMAHSHTQRPLPGTGSCPRNGSFTYTETSPGDGALSQKWLIHIHGDLSQGRRPVPEMAHSHARRPLSGMGPCARNGYSSQLGTGICLCFGRTFCTVIAIDQSGGNPLGEGSEPVTVSLYVNEP